MTETATVTDFLTALVKDVIRPENAMNRRDIIAGYAKQLESNLGTSIIVQAIIAYKGKAFNGADLKPGEAQRMVYEIVKDIANDVGSGIDDEHLNGCLFNIREQEDVCVLCGGDLPSEHPGRNNPCPLAPSSYECCDDCNTNKVIPARIELARSTRP